MGGWIGWDTLEEPNSGCRIFGLLSVLRSRFMHNVSFLQQLVAIYIDTRFLFVSGGLILF